MQTNRRRPDGLAHRRRPVEQLHRNGADGRVRADRGRAGPVQLDGPVRSARRHAQLGRPDHVPAHAGQGPVARLRVPRAETVAHHIGLAQARLVRRVRRHAGGRHLGQRHRHMDSDR